jgi:hypothetical protein
MSFTPFRTIQFPVYFGPVLFGLRVTAKARPATPDRMRQSPGSIGFTFTEKTYKPK